MYINLFLFVLSAYGLNLMSHLARLNDLVAVLDQDPRILICVASSCPVIIQFNKEMTKVKKTRKKQAKTSHCISPLLLID